MACDPLSITVRFAVMYSHESTASCHRLHAVIMNILLSPVSPAFAGAVRGGGDGAVPRLHPGSGCWSSVWTGSRLPAGLAGHCPWSDPSFHHWQV